MFIFFADMLNVIVWENGFVRRFSNKNEELTMITHLYV